MEEIEAETPKSSSLFPVFPPSQIPSTPNPTTSYDAVPEWLRNTSFTTDIAVINDAVSTNYEKIQFQENLEEEDEGEDVEKENQKGEGTRYELLHSSASDDDERYSKKKKRKNKRRKRQLSSDDYALSSSRKPDVRTWASSAATNVKDYYFDSRGDRDNLAFGSIYRCPRCSLCLPIS